jgi:predicted amidohydrolase YtcJ
MTLPMTIFQARKILTMNPMQPVATHVAVKEGRILAVGQLEEMSGWGDCDVDQHFADKILMPGLAEGHSHLHEGGLWRFPYVGYYDRRGPDGTLWNGLKSFAEVVDRLKQAETELTDPEQPLLAWGFDPIYFSGQRMTIRELDQVATKRPIAVLHASFHLMNVNSAMLDRAGITQETPIEGITCFSDGEPTGELCEFAAMFPVNRVIGNAFRKASTSREGLHNFASVSQLAGVTTAADLSNPLTEADIEALTATTAETGFPIRLFPAYRALGALNEVDRGIEKVIEVSRHNTDKLRLGAVKLVLDGSIQGFTARLRWPGYYNGSANGIWVTSPDEAFSLVESFHAAGFQLHIHTNGDEATEVALDAIEHALAKYPRWDHRHTLQHVQMADTAQFRRMANLGVCANLFANHIYYWGDAHYTRTMGPDRAHRMNACGTAQHEGVPFAIHSDAPITPIGPLFTAWCAVNRCTASGRILGESQRISVPQALAAITLGAAYTLKMDDDIGSIEVGKFADFCVLEDDPLAVAPETLKDIPIWGTVLAGQVFESP